MVSALKICTNISPEDLRFTLVTKGSIKEFSLKEIITTGRGAKDYSNPYLF